MNSEYQIFKYIMVIAMKVAKLVQGPIKTNADLVATSYLFKQQPKHVRHAQQDFTNCAQLVIHVLTIV